MKKPKNQLKKHSSLQETSSSSFFLAIQRKGDNNKKVNMIC